MKALIATAFIAAIVAGVLSHVEVIPLNSIAAPVLFAVGLVLVLLQLINQCDRRY